MHQDKLKQQRIQIGAIHHQLTATQHHASSLQSMTEKIPTYYLTHEYGRDCIIVLLFKTKYFTV